jgi:hypothetical protein
MNDISYHTTSPEQTCSLMSFRRSVLDLPRGLADCNQSALFSTVALQKCEKGLVFDVSLSNWFHVYFAVKHAVTLLLYHVSFVWACSSCTLKSNRSGSCMLQLSADLSNTVQKITCPVSIQFGKTWHYLNEVPYRTLHSTRLANES